MEYEKFNIKPHFSSDVTDVEAKVEDLYMAALRAIYTHDDKFTYTEDELKTKLVIDSEYPENVEAPFKKPHIIVTNISYSLNLNNSFTRNFSKNIYDDEGRIIGEQETVYIPYNLSLAVYAGKSSSRNLANNLINYISFIYKKVFDGLNLNISGISKGATQASAKYPEKIFETVIGIQGHVDWTGNSRFVDIENHLLKDIIITVKTGIEK